MEKIILAQIDNIAGDIDYNFNKIKTEILNAKLLNGNMIIFPDCALIGTPYMDLPFRHKSLIKYQLEKLEEIKNISSDIAVIISFINTDNDKCIAYINNCEVLNIITANNPDIIEFNNNKYGLFCGEYNEFNSENVLKSFKDNNVESIIHCSSSPSKCGKEFLLNNLLSSIAKNYSMNYIFVNRVGYGDNYSFAGTSRIYDKTGMLAVRGKSFEEDFVITENFIGKVERMPYGEDKYTNDEFSLDYKNDLERIYKSLISSIREYFNKTGFKKAVLGLSGGLDSSVCAALLVAALGKENVFGISLPTQITSDESKNDAKILADNLGINFFELPICQENETFKVELMQLFEKINTEKNEYSTTYENLQARIRATLLWSISNECKYMLPIATSDKSEAYIGYATINGDMSGGFAPIADITKTKVFALADFINKELKNVIPQNILEKPPGAELKFDETKGRTITAEEDNMPYIFLDEIIWHIENKNWGYKELIEHEFLYQKENPISQEQKENWIMKFFDKSQKAIFKWHLLPLSVIIDCHSINDVEYYQPILSKQLVK